MMPAIDLSSASELAERALRRSPGLGQFRKSPFRLLRLASTATAQQAVWQCNKALARARVGQALPDPDPVPWLPGGDEVELQEAAQIMESPLARVVEQLLWFDATGVLAALTAGDAAGLRRSVATTGEPSIAQRIDRANLCLLLGWSRLYDVGPAIAETAAAPPVALTWKTEGQLSVVADPHKLVHGAAHGKVAAWAELVGASVTAWAELLTGSDFADHVRGVIGALGDELLTGDDLEAVLAGIRTRLADLIVGELKLELAAGRLDRVGQLVSIAGDSKIDAETWLVAFRPLRTQFQLELADLAPDAETGRGVVADVDAYLDRLTSVAARWRPIDQARLLGLSELIDDALSEAFGKLRGESRATQLSERFSAVLDRIRELGTSPAFKERLRGYRERLVDVAKAMCHFCGREERELESCAVVTARIETHRERVYNGYRVHYKVGAAPVSRCKACALRHGFFRSVGLTTYAALAVALLLIAMVHPPTWFEHVNVGVGFFLLLAACACAIPVAWGAREITARRLTPAGHRKFRDYGDTHAVHSLRADGFQSFQYDFRTNAWARVTKRGAAGRHVGGLLKSLLWIALVIGYLLLRMASHR